MRDCCFGLSRRWCRVTTHMPAWTIRYKSEASRFLTQRLKGPFFEHNRTYKFTTAFVLGSSVWVVQGNDDLYKPRDNVAWSTMNYRSFNLDCVSRSVCGSCTSATFSLGPRSHMQEYVLCGETSVNVQDKANHNRGLIQQHHVTILDNTFSVTTWVALAQASRFD